MNRIKNLGNYAQKGNIPWNKGLKTPMEVRGKQRQAKLKNPTNYWLDKIRPDLRGEKHFFYGKKRLDVSGKNHWTANGNAPMKGENHWNWKGGITKPDKAERTRFRQIMQKKVFERDSYKCVFCKSNKDLQVDHIQSWAEYVEQRFNMDNCRTLCAKCHYKITWGKEMPIEVEKWGQNFKYVLKGGD